jgi:tripartite-type tricarboxylate transporter receptor subunit TctC
MKRSTWSSRAVLPAFVAWLAALLCTALPVAAQAQAYPARPVRMIVPAAPGGGLDLVARMLAGKVSEQWGQQIVVENRPGANFIVGTDAAVKAAPDGYTLLFSASPAITINPAVFPDLPHSPLRDLVPISLVSSNPMVLLVNNAVPAQSMQELIAHLRVNPGKLNHASNSASTMLTSELFKSLAKVDYADINYKGGILAVAATSAGETHFCFVDAGSATGAMKAGRVRAMAVTSPQRYKLLPDIPTLAEAGVAGYANTFYTVVLAPAGTPAAVIARVNAEIARAVAVPEVAARFESVGSEAVGSSSAEASRVLRADAEQWAKLVRERNIRFQ